MTDEQLIELGAKAIAESADGNLDEWHLWLSEAQAALKAYRSALPSTQADDEVREALEAARGLLCCSRPDLDSTMRKLYGENDRQRVLNKIDAALAKVKPNE